VENISKLHL
jgi:hypothetical protein